jgi:hypothetical protein
MSVQSEVIDRRVLLAEMGYKKELTRRARHAGEWKLFGRGSAVAMRDGLLAGILLLLVAPNGFVDLITMYGYFLGRFDAKAHFVAADFYDDNRNVIINNDALVLFP